MAHAQSAMQSKTLVHGLVVCHACRCRQLNVTQTQCLQTQGYSLPRHTVGLQRSHERNKHKHEASCQSKPDRADYNREEPQNSREAHSTENDSAATAGKPDSTEDPAEPESAPTEPQNVDWREFRARLVASDREQQDDASTSAVHGRWAHDVGKPEKGCLLLAHPLMFGNAQPYFSQAVIFLFEHDDTASAGFILNRPTERLLGKLVGADELCPEFADNTVYLGGDVGDDTMHFLHGCSDIQGAAEVVQGVFMGGFEEARFGIRTGAKQSSQFRWFNMYAGWGPGQLEAECAAGVWFTAAASSDVILNSQNLSGKAMWHTILEMMGGDYAVLSKNVRDAYPKNLPKDT